MKGQGPNWLGNCICRWQPVRVGHGDGHIRGVTRRVTVKELLQHHPHHFVCERIPDGPLCHGGMLPMDTELEVDRMYLLLPLPRLLPHLGNTCSEPPSCPCFSHRPNMLSSPDSPGLDLIREAPLNDDSKVKYWYVGNQGQLILVAAKRVHKCRHRIITRKVIEYLVFMGQRLLPQRLLDNGVSRGSIAGKSVQNNCLRNGWRPGLECISEEES